MKRRTRVRTTKNPGNVNVKRRELMVAGLAGASALLAGKGGSAYAQRMEEKGKVEMKVLKPVDSMVPGFPKVRLSEFTWQPGASMKATKMQNAMICECTQGTLEVTQDDKTFTAKKGHIWTCKVGTVEGTTNNGKTPATMRMIDLLTA
jgi:quercetin dioxygenase-like cupin family protein